MPTKPVISFTFAIDPNFSSGPASGNPVKIASPHASQGFIPGEEIGMEPFNYLFHHTGNWISDWIEQGTSSADQDTHIVETSSSGEIKAALLDVGGTSSASSLAPLRIDDNTGSNGKAIFAATNGSGDTVEFDQSGSGRALSLFSDGIGGTALYVTTLGNNAIAAAIIENQAFTGDIHGALQIIPFEEPDIFTDAALGEFWVDPTATNTRQHAGAVLRAGPHESLSNRLLRFWGTQRGHKKVYGESLGVATNTSGNFQNKLFLALDTASANDPSPHGKYRVHFSVAVAADTTSVINAKVKFTSDSVFTGTTILLEDNIPVDGAGSIDRWHTVSSTIEVDVPVGTSVMSLNIFFWCVQFFLNL